MVEPNVTLDIVKYCKTPERTGRRKMLKRNKRQSLYQFAKNTKAFPGSVQPHQPDVKAKRQRSKASASSMTEVDFTECDGRTLIGFSLLVHSSVDLSIFCYHPIIHQSIHLHFHPSINLSIIIFVQASIHSSIHASVR